MSTSKKYISLAVHTSLETSLRYVSETVDEKIWHWDLLESWKNMAFLVFFGLFWCFWVSFSLSRAVSACFWHCIWHLPTPDICLTHSDTILTLPDTLRHHPDTHQTPPYLVCMRPLGERVISEYHDIYSTGLNLYGIYPPQTSAWHTQTPYRHCQTPSDTIQTPLRNLHFTVIGLYRISILLVSVGPLGLPGGHQGWPDGWLDPMVARWWTGR